jgi:acyl-CoA thioesterase-1
MTGKIQQADPAAQTCELLPEPVLPRILVIGDSISMNYHEAAKAALQGVANYYRIEGNGGDSRRGVACAELWVGDGTQPGLPWDVIQFNHGLHDLKQQYDATTGAWGAYQVPVAEYQANLEREIQILKRTGAILVWCTTTPVPNHSIGQVNRRKDEDLIFNQAARQVMNQHPEILINDINRPIRELPAFDRWRQGADVHFWEASQQAALGRLVADGLLAALQKWKTR